jgi:hypothetical protein
LRSSVSHGSPRDARPLRVPPAAVCGDRLSDLAIKLDRLAPSHRDPEKYFETKADIVDELRSIAIYLLHEGGRL